MKRIPDEACASICGLFCGACPAFPNECHGCFSDYVREGCKGCADHGFLECATSHNVLRCYECEDFPCKKLEEFSSRPIINGICNHANVISDSMRMKEIGIPQWIEEKIKEHKCPKCGNLINWFEVNTSNFKRFQVKNELLLMKRPRRNSYEGTGITGNTAG